jgi:hypothetical protein
MMHTLQRKFKYPFVSLFNVSSELKISPYGGTYKLILKLLLRVFNVPGSNLGPETGYLD